MSKSGINKKGRSERTPGGWVRMEGQMLDCAAWKALTPYAHDLWKNVCEMGYTAAALPEEYGGIPGDSFYRIVINDELARAGSGGLIASLLTHTIGTPPIVNVADEELNRSRDAVGKAVDQLVTLQENLNLSVDLSEKLSLFVDSLLESDKVDFSEELKGPIKYFADRLVFEWQFIQKWC